MIIQSSLNNVYKNRMTEIEHIIHMYIYTNIIFLMKKQLYYNFLYIHAYIAHVNDLNDLYSRPVSIEIFQTLLGWI